MANNARIQQLLEFLKSEPSDLFLNYALGVEYAALNETHVMAEQQFKNVLELNADYIAAYYQLGKLLEARGANSEALAFYRTGLEKAKQQKNNKAVNEFGEAIFMLED